MKKALDTIKSTSHIERRITNDIVRNISRQIANRALETDALIVLGDIKHLRRRKQNTRGRKFNRKLSGFRYYKLRQYKIYKAALVGIKVIQCQKQVLAILQKMLSDRCTEDTRIVYLC